MAAVVAAEAVRVVPVHRGERAARLPAAARPVRLAWERRVALLKSDSLDPDLLDERARALLDYVDARDLTLMRRRP